MFEALELVYGVLNKEYLYQGQFERLEQGNTDFNTFVAEFYRLTAPLRRDENSLLNSFRRKLSPTMQRLTIGRQNESLDDLIEFCRRIDDDLKMQQQSRRNTANTPSSRTPTRTSTRTATPVYTGRPDQKDYPCSSRRGHAQSELLRPCIDATNRHDRRRTRDT